MKLKIYSTLRRSKIEDAIAYTKDYLKDFDIQFSEVNYLKENLKKKSLYETVLSWALSVLRPTTSLSTDYIQSLEHDGYDGVILFIDKFKAKEDGNLFGQHTIKDDKHYIEVYVTDYYYVQGVDLKGVFFEDYTKKALGAVRGQVEHTLIHELFHAYSHNKRTGDLLHAFIEEGHFEEYKNYLLVNTKMNTIKLYEETIKLLNTDVTPKDYIPDVVACAETVSTLISKVMPFPVIAGTYSLMEKLETTLGIERIQSPEKGAILMYATGTGNGKLKNGHVFICDEDKGDDTLLYSNDSYSGLLKQNYTLATARQRYVTVGGFKERFYKLI